MRTALGAHSTPLGPAPRGDWVSFMYWRQWKAPLNAPSAICSNSSSINVPAKRVQRVPLHRPSAGLRCHLCAHPMSPVWLAFQHYLVKGRVSLHAFGDKSSLMLLFKVLAICPLHTSHFPLVPAQHPHLSNQVGLAPPGLKPRHPAACPHSSLPVLPTHPKIFPWKKKVAKNCF